MAGEIIDSTCKLLPGGLSWLRYVALNHVVAGSIPAPVTFLLLLLRVKKIERRESQTARRPAATRNKWVRLPLASLY